MATARKSRLIARVILFAAVGDFLFAAFNLFRFVRLWLWLHRPDLPSDWNPPNYTISYWTLLRPLLFSVMWLVAWIDVKQPQNKRRKLLAVFLWCVMIGCYVVSWPDIVSSINAFSQPDTPKPFILYLYGFNEWDLFRFILLVAVFSFWSLASSEPDLDAPGYSSVLKPRMRGQDNMSLKP